MLYEPRRACAQGLLCAGSGRGHTHYNNYNIIYTPLYATLTLPRVCIIIIHFSVNQNITIQWFSGHIYTDCVSVYAQCGNNVFQSLKKYVNKLNVSK